MAKMQLALVIGGAVASSVGAAFKDVEGRIAKLEQKGNQAKVLKSTIGETMKLQAEWKRAHDTGAAGADKLLRKLNGNLDALRKQGVEVGRLGREYQRLGREARAADLQVKGHQQIQQGKAGLTSNLGRAAVGVGLAAVPTTISAGYQAIIRDIAIKSDIVNKPQEAQLSRTVIDTARDTGMSRNDVADLINQLVGAGMEVEKAMAYAPTAAKFAIGQGSSGVDTAAMIQALQQNAKITDPKVMQQALEAIAYQGQAGSFEASDMAKWFPQLLAGMEKNGVTGLDAVTSLGAMLQVQMKTAGSSDEAANNFKNWMEKIGAGDIQKNYEKVGIDYQKSLNTGLQKGMNVFEASMGLAMQYVEKTDPKKALAMKEAQAKIDKEVDPEKATAALEALEKNLRTGDVFADMQVKAALTAYAQNRGLYNTLKADSRDAEKVAGILDKNLAERRETSKQRWLELGQAVDDAMRSIGDAIRPATDLLATGLTKIAHGVTDLSDKLPGLVLGISGVAAAVMTFLTARSAFRIGKGMLNVLRGNRPGRGGSDEKGDEGGESRRDKVLGLVETGLKAFRKPGRGADGDGEPDARGNGGEGFDPVETGLKVLDIFREASNDGAEEDGDSGPQKVFVVNAGEFGGVGGSGDGVGSRRRRRRRGGRRTGGSGGGPGPRPGPPSPPPSPLGRVGRAVHSVRGFTRGLGSFPGGKLLDAIPGVLDTAFNAETQDEKAEGYGGVAGGMGGAWAGAAAGAAIGSMVPVIGTAIGGAIGMAIGGLGGEALGGWLGKKLFGEDKSEAAPGDVVRSIAAAAPSEAVKAPVKAVPAKVEQAFTFAPTMPITVHGDVKDPSQVVREAESALRSMWEGFQRQVAARQASTQLFDAAHV
ncbi:phage tail tape measure protein [Pseudomonas putida]|uniref:phage tail tape measure protein n=1 Tax=Pseudomonas putida TaxID=303 RepID=UPI0039E07E3A